MPQVINGFIPSAYHKVFLYLELVFADRALEVGGEVPKPTFNNIYHQLLAEF